MCKKLVEILRNKDYTTRNLLDFSYHQNYHKLIGTDLTRQTNTTVPQKVNFREKLEENDGATRFSIAEKPKKKKKNNNNNTKKNYSKLLFRFIQRN